MARKAEVRAQITIYAAVTFMLVMSLVCACINSAINSSSVVWVEEAARLAAESAFAGYHNKVLEEFDVMVLNQETGDKLLYYYAKENVAGVDKGEIVQFVNAGFADKVRMTDREGEGIEKQAAAYMKYDILPQLLEKMLGVEKQTKKCEKVTEITEEIVCCQEEIIRLDSTILEVISLVEGIKTNSGGLVIQNKKAVPTGEYFAKAVITAPLTMKEAGIDTKNVYAAMSVMGTKYTNVNELLDGMKEYAETFEMCINPSDGEASHYSDSADICVKSYENNYNRLKELLYQVRDKSKEALKKLETYDEDLEDYEKKLSACIDDVNESSELLGEELRKSFSDDIEQMKRSNQMLGKKICNTSFMKVGLRHNIEILDRTISKLESVNGPLTKDNVTTLITNIDEYRKSFKGIGNNLLKFDYSDINFNVSGSGMKVIETLKNTLEDGICGLVLEDKKVSDGKISYGDLASSCAANGSSESASGSQSTAGGTSIDSSGMYDTLLFDEYIMDRFENGVDWVSGDSGSVEKESGEKSVEKSAEEKQKWCELQYLTEYILCGKDSDKSNLNEVILKISVIREGANLMHLIMDGEKRKQAYSLASSLVGYTGNAAIVKIAQYLIMAVWAYGESICDLRTLLAGDTVPVIKTSESWQLSLDKLMAMDFSVKGGKSSGDSVNNNSKDNSRGKGLLEGQASYEDYLRMLLLVQNSVEKRYRVMDIIELRMIAIGEKQFRMRDYIWAATIEVTVKMQKPGKYYVRDITYGYV